MEEQKVNFDTAKLAKEKGFNIRTEWYWQVNEKINLISHRNGVPSYYADGCATVYQPTQSLLQKWLREVHNVNIWVNPFKNNEDEKAYNWLSDEPIYSKENEYGYETYEDALEIGLQEALKLI